MKKCKKLYSLCLALLLVLLLASAFLGIKVNASDNVNGRSSFSFDHDESYVDIVMFSIVSTEESAFVLLECEYEDDGNYNTVSLITLSYNSTYDYYYNNNLDLILYPSTFYVCAISHYTRPYIDIFEVDISFDSNNNITISMGNRILHLITDIYYNDMIYDRKIIPTFNCLTLSRYYSGRNYNVTENDIRNIASSAIRDWNFSELLGGNYLTQSAFNSGRDIGYREGYLAGESTVTAFDRVWAFLSSIFGMIGSIFAVELMPHIPLGIFLLVPVFFMVLGFVFWIWKGRG